MFRELRDTLYSIFSLLIYIKSEKKKIPTDGDGGKQVRYSRRNEKG